MKDFLLFFMVPMLLIFLIINIYTTTLQDNHYNNNDEPLININKPSIIIENREIANISFKVTNVDEKNVTSIKLFNINDFIENEIKATTKDRRLIELKLKQSKVLMSSFNDGDDDEYVIGDYNSFVYGAWEAYNNHHHLEIRPENIWMAIISQFSLYVNKYSENLRNKFVDFNGKKILEVNTSFPILHAPMDQLTLLMSEEIQKNIKDPSIKDWLIPNFTTTTETDKVIFSVALMSTLKKYFEYHFVSKCGLPRVTMYGTVSDWINLKERVERLIEFDNEEGHMKKWVDYLLPVMDNFIKSVNGSPDLEWWNKIVDHHQQSGSDVITGWLSEFCVFDKDGEYEDNAKFWGKKIESNWPKISVTSIANGFVSTPVLLIDADGTQYQSELYAGHLTSKVKNTKITPSLNWFIVADISNITKSWMNGVFYFF